MSADFPTELWLTKRSDQWVVHSNTSESHAAFTHANLIEKATAEVLDRRYAESMVHTVKVQVTEVQKLTFREERITRGFDSAADGAA